MEPEAAVEQTKWFYLEGDTPRGPFTVDEMRAFLAAGLISRTTCICRDGDASWITIQETSEFTRGSRKSKKKLVLAIALIVVLLTSGGFVFQSHWAFSHRRPPVQAAPIQLAPGLATDERIFPLDLLRAPTSSFRVI
jgi:hypothetical protein